MIVTYLVGGLGNQLFQYAVARNLAKKLNTELKLDLSYCEQEGNDYQLLYRLADFKLNENVSLISKYADE